MKRIFVACPIGSDQSPERLRSDTLLKHVITPVATELSPTFGGVEVVRSDKIGEPGRITTQILRELANSDVVIADLTSTNPNVMYEIGVRQALVKPYVLMAEMGQGLPFDLSDFRTIFYVLDLDGVDRAQDELRSHLDKALRGQVASSDTAIFGTAKGVDADAATGSTSQQLLEVLEACNQVLRETQETKSLVTAVGNIAVDIQQAEIRRLQAMQEAKNQENGMWFFSQMLQHPDSIDKMLPLLQTFAEMGAASKAAELLEEPLSPQDGSV